MTTAEDPIASGASSVSLSSPTASQSEDLPTFVRLHRKLKTRLPQRPSSNDEFEDYCAAGPYDIGSHGALQWWREETQRKRYPRLSQMAVNILSIPAMSAEAERVFSGARRTIDWDRSKLGADTIEWIECLKHRGSVN
jgi:hAT family C-terminal dimerisation region